MVKETFPADGNGDCWLGINVGYCAIVIVGENHGKNRVEIFGEAVNMEEKGWRLKLEEIYNRAAELFGDESKVKYAFNKGQTACVCGGPAIKLGMCHKCLFKGG